MHCEFGLNVLIEPLPSRQNKINEIEYWTVNMDLSYNERYDQEIRILVE